MGKISTFRDLLVWQKGHLLVLEIYKYTSNFPAFEQFGLTSQLRRSAVSVTSNIAEGFSRRNPKEKAQFYYMAHGSLSELENQLQIAFDLKYLSLNESEGLRTLFIETGKLLNGLIKSTVKRK